MSKSDCCSSDNNGVSVNVQVNVTKIIKYLCVAGVLIVGIIFGIKCFNNMLTDGEFPEV